MSAFLCSNEHLSALGLYAARAGLTPSELPGEFDPPEKIAEAIGRELYAANCASLADRYGDRDHPPFMYDPPSLFALYGDASQGPIRIIKAAHCFEYQACEWRGWEASHARLICHAIVEHAIRKLPWYETAAWGWPQ